MPKKPPKVAPPTLRDQRIAALVRKELGAHAAISLSDNQASGEIKEYIPTGIDVLDHYVIGRGGLPIGRMSEIYGPEGCGKTALSYAAIAQFQRRGGVCAIWDAEYSFDEVRATVYGVDVESLIMLYPDTLEEGFDAVTATLKANDPKEGPMLIVHDSLAASEPEKPDEVAAMARVCSKRYKRLHPLLQKHRAHFMVLNQVRVKMGVLFGDNTTTPGGNAPKFFASLRLQFLGGKAIKNAKEEHTGKVVTALAVKNRLASPWRKARVRLDYAMGFNNVYSTLEHAKRLGVIEPREKGFKGKGKESVDAYLEAAKRLAWRVEVPSEPVGEDEADGDDVEQDDDD